MRRKIVIIALILMVTLAVGGFANMYGVGAAFSLDALGGLPSSAMLSLKVPQLPIMWGVGAQLGGGTFNLAVTADWWLFQQNLVSFIGLYVGPGLYISLPSNFEIGGRIPIGLNAYPLDFLEIFAELAVAHPFWTEGGLTIPSLRLQAAFGFRFWFDM
ncbi:MAG: hypothetical protein KOO61_09505 [Spirochaetales bacterium]|nr:hypothetical protein [Spirochaetales bacterium]